MGRSYNWTAIENRLMRSSVLTFYFQSSFSGWMPTYIYQQLYDYLKLKYKELLIKDNTSIKYNHNSSYTSGPHHMIIKNIATGLYKTVTYCDNACDLLNDEYGWRNNDCLGIYSSVDSQICKQIKPTSYCVYNIDIEKTINQSNIKFTDKYNKKLFFRGYLYGNRYSLQQAITDNSTLSISDNKISYAEYIKELNSYLINISFNGVAEICNRDLEILAVGSVLLRPKLTRTNFYNPLIPEFHYVSFDISNDPKQQLEIILDKYHAILKDEEYMNFIAKNGNEWYNNNGSSQANVKILIQTLNIEELM